MIKSETMEEDKIILVKCPYNNQAAIGDGCCSYYYPSLRIWACDCNLISCGDGLTQSDIDFIIKENAKEDALKLIQS